MIIYCLPGVGCDHRLFDRLELPPDLRVVKLDWPGFTKGDSLGRIAACIHPLVEADEPHILAGVSMGGMVAQELAVLTRPVMVVLISSWTGPAEFPPYVKVAKALNLPHLIGDLTMRATWPLKRLLGRRDRTTDKLLWDMARGQGAAKIRHGVQAVLRWKGSPWQGPVVRIHGTNDHVIPLRFPVDQQVEGGSHIMVLDHSAEISRFMREALAFR